MEDLVTVSGETRALGWTHLSDGALLPFADVDCEKIRRFIAPAVAGGEDRERDLLLGRALARVLAHEMYHIFANTSRHTAFGLAKPFYTAYELIGDSFTFHEKDRKLLREGKLKNLISIRERQAHFGGGGGR